jgi:vancomycin resistance protein YoaR
LATTRVEPPAAARPARRRRRRARVGVWHVVVLGGIALVALAAVVGLVFAGSSTRLPAGIRVAGVDVGGLKPGEARALLERKASAVLHVPVAFTAGGRTFHVTADELGLRVDWRNAVDDASRQGAGFGPLRGFARLDVRIFGSDVTPETQVYSGALRLEVQRIANAVDRPHREPSLRLKGTSPVVVPGTSGYVLDRSAAASTVVRALASLERGTSVALPVGVDRPRLTPAALAPAAAQVRRALAGPVRLQLGPTSWRLPRWRVAQLLELPADGRTTLRIGGPAATKWLAALGKRVARAPRDAGFAVNGNAVHVLPAKPGIGLDGVATARALLRAALRPTNRVALVAVTETQPKRSTAAAEAMGITGLVSSYTTVYGGIANRIHNVQLVAHLVDGKLIAPGATFSFNQATGARTAAKGFLAAPVIINGEVQTGLGGGVCQVSTTVFNAAFEAGLEITQRTNHALYISHYPQGRDATVDYPDVDLKFVNDTPHWLLLRTFVGSSELTVSLYGTPLHRKVVSTTTPLVQVGAPPVKKTIDPSLKPGETVVDDPGEAAFHTSVHRLVYGPSGKLLHDDTWYSSYVASPELVRVGPKKKPAKPKQTTTGPTTGETTTATTPAATGTTTVPTTTRP